MSGTRKAEGNTLITIQDLDAVDGLSTFCAATHCQFLLLLFSSLFLSKKQNLQLTPSLRNCNLFLRWQFHQLHTKPTSQNPLRLIKDYLELPRPLLAQHFGTYICASNRQPRKLAGQRQAHHFLDHHIHTCRRAVLSIAVGCCGLLVFVFGLTAALLWCVIFRA